MLTKFLKLFKRSGLDAAGGGRRWKDDRRALDAGKIIHTDASTVGARAESYRLNNPNGTRIVETLVGNLVGTGITPQPLHPIDSVRQRRARDWSAWTDSADAEARTDLYGLQQLAVSDMVTFGEALFIFEADPLTAAPATTPPSS
jgi:capsid protein